MERAYERFLRYAVIDTMSDPTSPTCPSTAKQMDFAKLLVEEMLAIGITDAHVDEFGYVYGTIPANIDKKVPVVGLIAHMDIVDELPCGDIRPQIVKNYDGSDIVLKEGMVLSPQEFPSLLKHIGKTLITTDGNTVLGSDDKAGIAEILTLCEYLIQNPTVPHGTLKIGFTPDEEIGRGADKFDVEGFGADFAYTLDGGALGEITYESFNASSAIVKITGKSIHPGSAKGIMQNAILIANEYMNLLPEGMKPAFTENYEGFIHVTDFIGRVDEAEMQFIIRDHDAKLLEDKKAIMVQVADFLNARYGEGVVEVTLKDSYRNMAEVVLQHPAILDAARAAMKAVDVEPQSSPIRGGTDGSRLSFMGLPCPNLCVAGNNAHGPYEYCVVEDMDTIVEMLKNLVRILAEA